MVMSDMSMSVRHDDPRAIRLGRVRRLSRMMAIASVAVAVLLGAAMLLYWCLTPADMPASCSPHRWLSAFPHDWPPLPLPCFRLAR